MDEREYTREDNLWNAFQVFDRDNSGTISKQELKKALADGLNGQITDKEATELVNMADTNGDNVIDFAEFKAMMQAKVGADEDVREQIMDGGRKGELTQAKDFREKVAD